MHMHVYAYIDKSVIKSDNTTIYFFEKVSEGDGENEKFPKVTVTNRLNIYVMNIGHRIIHHFWEISSEKYHDSCRNFF